MGFFFEDSLMPKDMEKLDAATGGVILIATPGGRQIAWVVCPWWLGLH